MPPLLGGAHGRAPCAACCAAQRGWAGADQLVAAAPCGTPHCHARAPGPSRARPPALCEVGARKISTRDGAWKGTYLHTYAQVDGQVDGVGSTRSLPLAALPSLLLPSAWRAKVAAKGWLVPEPPWSPLPRPSGDHCRPVSTLATTAGPRLCSLASPAHFPARWHHRPVSARRPPPAHVSARHNCRPSGHSSLRASSPSQPLCNAAGSCRWAAPPPPLP